MQKCVELLETIQGSIYLVAAYTYLVSIVWFKIYVFYLKNYFKIKVFTAEWGRELDWTKQICVQISSTETTTSADRLLALETRFT